MNLDNSINNYIKTVLSGVKTWALSTFAKKRDFDELNSRMYYSEQVEKFFFRNQQISPMDSYGNYVNMSFLEKQCDEIRVGDTLNVVWDGTEYECKVFMYDGALMIGNKSIIGTMMGESFADTGEPFVIAIWEGQYVEFYYTDMVSESHVVSIFGTVEKVHKIDEKYLPEMSAIGAEGTGKNAEIFNDYLRNTASGNYSHAEGSFTHALGYHSHTEGLYTTTEGDYSHAEGSSTNALGHASHAEGDSTTAEGYGSHAEGCSTNSEGNYSHAEGYYTTAAGKYSHAEGYYTTAASDYQHAQGKHNVIDDSNLYAHIIGNGSYAGKLSNAHTIDWDGNAWFAGDVYVGSDSGTNKDDGSIKLATMYDLHAVKDGIVLKDSVTGYNYIVQMKNGTLASYYACDHIEVTVMPMKTEYMIGSAFDPTGMIVTAVLQDGSAKIIEDYIYTKYVLGDYVKIQYVECGIVYSTSIVINVTEFDAAAVLIDFTYANNFDNRYTITGWKGTLNGEPSTEMIMPDNIFVSL